MSKTNYKTNLRAHYHLKDLMKVMHESPKNCEFGKVWKTSESLIEPKDRYKEAMRFSSTLFISFFKFVLRDIVENDSELSFFDKGFRLKMLSVVEYGIKKATMRLDVSTYGYDRWLKIITYRNFKIRKFSINDFKIFFSKPLKVLANKNVEKYSNVYYIVRKNDT